MMNCWAIRSGLLVFSSEICEAAVLDMAEFAVKSVA